MAIISGVATVIVNGMPAVVDTLANAFVLTNEQLGFIASSYLVGNFIVVCTSPFWVRRVNWRRAMATGTVVGIALLGILVLAPSVSSFTACFFFLGGAMACCYAPVLAFWSDVDDPARATSVGILAQVAAAAALAFAVPHWFAPKSGVVGLATCLIAALVLCLFVIPGTPKGGATRAFRPDHGAARSQVSAPLIGLALMGLYFVGFIGLWAFLGRIGVANGLSEAAANSAVSVSLLIGASPVIVTSIVGTRFGYVTPILLAAVTYGVFLLLLLLTRASFLFAIALILFNGAANLALPYQLEIIAKSDVRGRYFVLTPAFQSAGAAAGPYLFGMLSARGEYGSVYVCFVLSVAVSFVGYLALANHLRLTAAGTRSQTRA
jgi:hypothetical protein